MEDDISSAVTEIVQSDLTAHSAIMRPWSRTRSTPLAQRNILPDFHLNQACHREPIQGRN